MYNWLKKILQIGSTHKDRHLESDLMDEEEKMLLRLDHMTSRELTAEYVATLAQYRKGIKERWSFHPADYGDATMVSAVRDYLHLILERMQSKDARSKKGELRELDREWQKWCLDRIKIDFADRARYPVSKSRDKKDHWWWWIDRLDELTNQNLKTL